MHDRTPLRPQYKLLRFWRRSTRLAVAQDKPCQSVPSLINPATCQSEWPASLFNLSLPSMDGASLWTNNVPFWLLPAEWPVHRHRWALPATVQLYRRSSCPFTPVVKFSPACPASRRQQSLPSASQYRAGTAISRDCLLGLIS